MYRDIHINSRFSEGWTVLTETIVLLNPTWSDFGPWLPKWPNLTQTLGHMKFIWIFLSSQFWSKNAFLHCFFFLLLSIVLDSSKSLFHSIGMVTWQEVICLWNCNKCKETTNECRLYVLRKRTKHTIFVCFSCQNILKRM